jgi:hypothetical protein
MLGVVFIVTLTSCVTRVDGPQVGSVYVSPVFADQDDYVYYPGYQMYYGSRSHKWYNREGSSWVARPAPHGVSMNVIHSAPSVTMDFHDSPAAHHAQVTKKYPKNWKPSPGR